MTKNEVSLIYISLLAVGGSVLTPLWFLQGMQKLRALSIISVVFKLLQLILLVICVNDKSDLLLAGWIFFGSGFLLGLCAFIYTLYYFKIRFVFPGFGMIMGELKGGFAMFLSVFFSSIYIQGTGVFLKLITGNNDVVTYFSTAEKIVRAATSMFNPFIQAFLPFISKMFMMNRQMGGMIFFKFLYVILGITIFTALMVYLCSGLIIEIMFKPGMEPAIVLIGILCPVIVFGNLANLLGNNLYIQLGWAKVTVWVMLAVALLNTALCLLLIPAHGAAGAAVSLTCTEITAALCFYGYYRYKNRFEGAGVDFK